MDSICLERNPSALQIFDFPTHSPHWRAAQKVLHLLWKKVDLELAKATQE